MATDKTGKRERVKEIEREREKEIKKAKRMR